MLRQALTACSCKQSMVRSARSPEVPVEVGNSNVEGLEVALQSGQDVTGTIKVEGDEQVNVGSVRIFLQPKENYPMFNASFPVTKDDGAFLIKNVTPDTYNLRVGGLQNQVYLKAVYNGSQEAKNAEIADIAWSLTRPFGSCQHCRRTGLRNRERR